MESIDIEESDVSVSFLERTWQKTKDFVSFATSLWMFMDMITDVLAVVGYYRKWENVSIFAKIFRQDLTIYLYTALGKTQLHIFPKHYNVPFIGEDWLWILCIGTHVPFWSFCCINGDGFLYRSKNWWWGLGRPWIPAWIEPSHMWNMCTILFPNCSHMLHLKKTFPWRQYLKHDPIYPVQVSWKHLWKFAPVDNFNRIYLL